MFVKRSPGAQFGSIMAGVILIVGLWLISATAANATLLLQLQRINDSTAILSGSGSTVFADIDLRLQGAASTGGGAFDLHVGDFTMGGFPLTDVFIFTNLLFLGIGGLFPAGAVPSGSSTITLDVETWAPIGTVGNICDAANCAGTLDGTWEMVTPVSEPNTLAIFVLGLAGLGFFMTRRRRVV